MLEPRAALQLVNPVFEIIINHRRISTRFREAKSIGTDESVDDLRLPVSDTHSSVTRLVRLANDAVGHYFTREEYKVREVMMYRKRLGQADK